MANQEILRTLGEQLRYLRESAELSLEDLAHKTGIQKKYLEWLEDERFDLLPAPVYVRGFVTHWAKACDANVTHTLLQLDRVQALLLRDKRKEVAWTRPSKYSFIITGRMLTVLGVAVIVLSGALYVGAQYLHIGGSPMVEIQYPASLEVIVSDQWIVIQGSTENIKHLTVAGQEIDLSPDGSFSQQVALQEGINVVRIEGKGKNGESIEVIRKIVQINASPTIPNILDSQEQNQVDPVRNSPTDGIE